MKITIYELLGLIKEGKAPNKIKYDNYEWYFTELDYSNHKLQQCLFCDYIENRCYLYECLNDEVEIIEEEKEILKWGELALKEIKTKTDYTIRDLQTYIEVLMETQNELIDVINNMRDKE